jgi:hypothetical protein
MNLMEKQFSLNRGASKKQFPISRQKRLVQYIKSRTRAKLWYHSCGSIVEYIPDLLDNGIDILNPVQISAKGMEPAKLEAQYGDRLVFWGGGVDTQHVLPRGTPAAARAWVEPLLDKLRADASGEVITELEPLRERVEGTAREPVERGRACLATHRERLDYGTAQKQGEPLGSWAMESICGQYQGRFKRTGQFWSQSGDEALRGLETSRRNGRWALLFPHAQPLDPSKN